MIGLLLKHGGSSGVAPPLQQQGFAAPSASPSRGKKRALLIGINYRGTRSELRGCITDTQYMHYCLVKRFGFKRDDILMLNEDQRNPYQIVSQPPPLLPSFSLTLPAKTSPTPLNAISPCCC